MHKTFYSITRENYVILFPKQHRPYWNFPILYCALSIINLEINLVEFYG